MDFIPQSATDPTKVYVTRTKLQSFLLIVLIGALNTVTPFSIDMYLPAFNTIAKDLHTDMGHLALSVSTYFLGFALGQILYGPLLDRFGRKRPLYVGLVLYVFATLACGMSSSIEILLALRFLQALSGCVASVAAMAMVLDFFPPEKSARIISLLVLVLSASPLLAPSVGGLIVNAWGWRYVFVALAVIVAIMLVVVFFFLPEGQQPDKSVSLMPKDIISGFHGILRQPVFYVYALAGTFSFSGLFVYVAGSPAIFMDEFHISPNNYSLIFAGLSIGFIGASQANHWLGARYSNAQVFKAVLLVQLFTSVLFAIAMVSGFNSIGIVLTFLFVILGCAGLTFPNAAALALNPFHKNAGTASALLGFIQIGIGGSISAGVGMSPYAGTVTVSVITALASAVAYMLVQLAPKSISVDTSN